MLNDIGYWKVIYIMPIYCWQARISFKCLPMGTIMQTIKGLENKGKLFYASGFC